jgi:microcystin-dependent protein
MKKMLFAVLLLIPLFVFCQADLRSLGFNYSALVRDTAGRVQPSKPVTLRFTLLQGQSGTVDNSPWVETQNVTTDAYGFVNVTIGKGERQSGVDSFKHVDFSLAEYWILIEVKNSFTGAYDPLAKQGFQAVPYAKVAGSLVGGSVVPAGTIVAFGGDLNHIPDGWLLCDGREISVSDSRYQALFNAIQYNWGKGAGNDQSKFRVPQTQGYFLRGVSNTSGIDPDAGSRTAIAQGGNGGNSVGSFQGDILMSHQHIAPIATNAAPWGLGGVQEHMVGGSWNQAWQSGLTSPAGGAETRPKNVYVNYIIKL